MNAGQRSASRRENCAIAAAVFAASCQSVSGAAVPVERGHPHVARQELEAVRAEAEIAGDVGAQRADAVGQGRHAEARAPARG